MPVSADGAANTTSAFRSRRFGWGEKIRRNQAWEPLAWAASPSKAASASRPIKLTVESGAT